MHGRERFIKGDIKIKKEILADIGSNPVLLDGKLQIIPHPYLEPIEKEYKELEEKYLKVRTLPQQMKKDAIAAIRSEWLGRQVSFVETTEYHLAHPNHLSLKPQNLSAFCSSSIVHGKPFCSFSERWLGRQGSNLRMTVPKTVALPLGDAPLLALLT